ANGTIKATLLDIAGNACAATTPAMTLTLLLPDGHTALGRVPGSDGAGCPAIGDAPWATIGAPGTYYVRISTNSDVPKAFDYSLQLEQKYFALFCRTLAEICIIQL